MIVEIFTEAVFVIDSVFFQVLSEVLIVISVRQKLLVSQIMHANTQPFNYIKSVLAKQKF